MKGKIVHIEIPAEDTQRAMKFWGELTGWSFKNYAEGQEGAPEYNMFEGEPGGGLYPAREGEKGPVPSMGWFAPAKDPEGNEFSVWQSDESAPMPEGMGAQTASS